MAGSTDKPAAPAAEPPLRHRVAAAGPEGSQSADTARLAAHMAALGQITPAVAHDLRGPINAMVFNLEILKETVASGRGADPGGRERLLRYVEVLREELGRLHRGMEAFLSLSTSRDDRVQSFDLRDLVGELALVLAGPARKQLVQVASDLPPHPVSLEGNRYRLRQALLQVGLAVLAEAERGQTLRVALRGAAGDAGEADTGRTTLWLGASGEPAPAGDSASGGVSPGSLELAGPLLAAEGARLRPAGQTGGERGYEIEWSFPTHG